MAVGRSYHARKYYDVILFGVEFYGIADGRGAVPNKN